ncbi:peptide deformylase [Candidatus Carsonella ruddii]|uniref:Peptide deformylase n=1 Tax=Candidatus Carsonella ruddii PC isolate NHV TaxID=1202540 RepID=J3TEU8_CARRU|nr:peptide deformylase [Candidatus Carsonella ruddii]AFP84402.1 peptide deformylase [Candidatus Carsonella ruddii PC isolate NHV]
MLLKLLNFNDKRIRFFLKKTKIKFNYYIFYIIKQMLIIMYKNNGIGISTSQINCCKNIIICDINIKKKKPLIMINPEIIINNTNHTLGLEGCLSIKNFLISLLRFDKIYVKYLNIYNKKKKKIFNGIVSRCIQHEIDHLKGKLLLDYSKYKFTTI